MAVLTTPTQLEVVELATDTVGKQNYLGNGPDLAMVTTPLVVIELATDTVAKQNALVHWCGRGDSGADLAVPTTPTQLVVVELATDMVEKQNYLGNRADLGLITTPQVETKLATDTVVKQNAKVHLCG